MLIFLNLKVSKKSGVTFDYVTSTNLVEKISILTF